MKRSFAAAERLKTWNRKRVGKLRVIHCARSRLPKPVKQGVTEAQLARVLAARRKRQAEKTS
jgi:hypothetical protein